MLSEDLRNIGAALKKKAGADGLRMDRTELAVLLNGLGFCAASAADLERFVVPPGARVDLAELDGETVYACTARLESREMTLAPLSNKKLVRDLVTEIAPPAERFAAKDER